MRIDLRQQVQSILPRVYGGTDNQFGAASRWLLVYKFNDLGSTIPLYSLVQMANGINLTQSAGQTVSGVVVGRLNQTSGILEEVDCVYGDMVAFAVAGLVEVLTTGAATTGYFVSASSTAGKALVGSTVVAGTFGQVIFPVDSGHAIVLMGAGVVPTPSGTPSFATPAIVLGTAAAAGAASTVIRSDSTIVAFDTTAPADVGTAAAGSVAKAARRDHVHATGASTPTTIAFGDAAAIGSGPAAAMTDHRHGMAATPPTGVGPILIDDTHSTPLIFDDLLQNDDMDDLLYTDL